VTYVFYDGEEIEAERNGLLRLSRNAPELLRGDLAVLLEPTGGLIEGGCQGTMRAEVTTRGIRAHSARSWRGRNAIHGAGAILDALRSYRPREPEVDGLVYHEGLNAVKITGGVASNVIPDECVVTVNYRFAPDRTAEQAAGARARGVRRVRREDHRRRAAGPARADRSGHGGPAHGGRRDPPRQDGLDGRGQVRHPRPARSQLRPGDPEVAHSVSEHVPLAQIAECEAKLLAWLAA
jgi:Acetylornithine deacetylase/Succinyl-diaminopimelate desuccinylase and related deacylases